VAHSIILLLFIHVICLTLVHVLQLFLQYLNTRRLIRYMKFKGIVVGWRRVAATSWERPEDEGAGKVGGGRRKHFAFLVYLCTTSRWCITLLLFIHVICFDMSACTSSIVCSMFEYILLF